MTSGSPANDRAGEVEEAQAVDVPVSRLSGLAAGLMAGAAAALVGAVVLLGLAAALPAVVGVADSAPEPAGWARWLALPAGVLVLVVLALLNRSAPAWLRLLVAGCTVALLVVSGWLAWRGLPVPGPELGLGRRIPWLLVGCGLGVVAAAVYAVGAGLHHRAGRGRSGRVFTTTTAAAVVLVLAAGTFGGVRAADDWIAAQNLDIAHAQGPLGAQRASTLDGTTRWHGPGSRASVATRGGVVVAAGPGIYAVDPATGEQRWHYYRWGTSFFTRGGLYNHEGPVVSDDGRYVAVTAIRDPGLDPLSDSEPSTSQVYVFDAVRGRLLGRFDARDENIWYVDENIVVLDDGREHPRALTAYRHDGSRAWAFRPEEDCVLGAVVGLGASVLVGHNRDGTAKVSVRDAASGREQWHWAHDGYISSNGVVVPQSGGAAGTVLLDLPREDFLGKDPGRHTLTALDADTGETRWSHANLRVGHRPAGVGYSHSALYTAGTLVLVGPAKGDDRVELVGVNPANGTELWRREVTNGDVWLQDYAPPTDVYQGLDAVVGATAGRIVLAGAVHGLDRDQAVRVEVVDARNGETVRSALLSGQPPELVRVWAVHVVGDTVTLSLSPENARGRYLVGLG